MTCKKIRLYTPNGFRVSISSLWYYNECSITELRDAVEDAKDGKDLLNRLRQLKLMRIIEADRETLSSIRFKTIDGFGNVEYLEFWR